MKDKDNKRRLNVRATREFFRRSGLPVYEGEKVEVGVVVRLRLSDKGNGWIGYLINKERSVTLSFLPQYALNPHRFLEQGDISNIVVLPNCYAAPPEREESIVFVAGWLSTSPYGRPKSRKEVVRMWVRLGDLPDSCLEDLDRDPVPYDKGQGSGTGKGIRGWIGNLLRKSKKDDPTSYRQKRLVGC